MPDLALALFFLLVLLVAAFVAIKVSHQAQDKIHEQYEKLSENLKLELESPEPTMMGLYRRNPRVFGELKGRELSIFCKGYGMDDTRQTDTSIRVACKGPKDFDFVLSRRNATGKLGQVGRKKEQRTGETEFDDLFLLKSSKPEALKALFTPEFCRTVQEKLTRDSAFLECEKGVLSYIESGLIMGDKKRARLEGLADYFCEVAEGVEKLGSSS